MILFESHYFVSFRNNELHYMFTFVKENICQGFLGCYSCTYSYKRIAISIIILILYLLIRYIYIYLMFLLNYLTGNNIPKVVNGLSESSILELCALINKDKPEET